MISFITIFIYIIKLNLYLNINNKYLLNIVTLESPSLLTLIPSLRNLKPSGPNSEYMEFCISIDSSGSMLSYIFFFFKKLGFFISIC